MSGLRRLVAIVSSGVILWCTPAAAAVGEAEVSGTSIAIFVVLVIAALLVTRWAAGKNRTRADFYVAHGRITAGQNSLAIAGEFISAGTLLGYTALFFSAGVDAFIYVVGALAALCVILFVIGERLRNLGRYTFADVCALRFEERPVRIASAANTLAILMLMMVGQLVGAGAMMEILIGLHYEAAVLITGSLITIYVMFGGMYAATWVQIVKAVLLLFGGTILAVLVLARFGFSADALFAAAIDAHRSGEKILAPGGLVRSVGDAVSLALTLALGSAGLPHLLMRFFTVRDAHAAGRSVLYAIFLMGFFYLLLAIFGFGAVALLADNGAYLSANGTLRGSDNMALLHLAQEIGGPALFGAMSAIVFATSLAVISGLSIAAAATISHDIYGRVLGQGRPVDERREMLVSRVAVASFCALGMLLALAVKEQNIIFMVALGVSIAAGVNFPLLIASMYWRGVTTRGFVVASWVGLALCVVLIVLGPTIWVGVLNNPKPLFPWQYPTLISLPVVLLLVAAISRLDMSARAQHELAAFESLRHRALTGTESSHDPTHPRHDASRISPRIHASLR